jgi:hypothetical protein
MGPSVEPLKQKEGLNFEESPLLLKFAKKDAPILKMWMLIHVSESMVPWKSLDRGTLSLIFPSCADRSF